ncbi:CHAT domain-containing protein [Nostoc parmelioides]|uniref:CHAT domain-containing protein n=1 Tax=Nostoc parmelioides TaxID=1521621 RepID=UPI0018EF70DC|nr:CHAT domain-containing protein [Nostoc parmelioides]
MKSFFYSWLVTLFTASLILCIYFGSSHPAAIVNAQTPDADKLVNQGIQSYTKGEFYTAIQNWETALDFYQKNNDAHNIAIINENLARTYQQLGNKSLTLSYWEKVKAYYHSQKDLPKVGRILTEIAQIYSNSGQTKKAISLLCGADTLTCQTGSALQIAQEQKDKLGEVAALGSLGEAHRLQGNYDLSIKYLETVNNSQNQPDNFAILNSLANAYAGRAQLWNLRAKSAKNHNSSKENEFIKRSQDDYKIAINALQKSIVAAAKEGNQIAELRSHLNLIKLAYRTVDSNILNPHQIEINIQQSLAIIGQIPDSLHKVYAEIELANLPSVNDEFTSSISQCYQKMRLPELQVKQLFHQAIKTAQKLQDARSTSYALGELGHLYECQKAYKSAWKLTNQAIWFADQNLQAKDSLYLWEWQAGRILAAQKQFNQALSFYERAYKTLEELRNDILTTNRDFQFDFRDVVEPVYRQLAQLQLELATSDNQDSARRNQQLNSALLTINSLRQAEIQNYFGNDCILAAFNNKPLYQAIEKDTAVISSIIFENKTGILLSLPNQQEYLHWVENKTQENLRQEISQFRNSLLAQQTINYNTKDAGNIYDAIISPIEKYLTEQKIKTLVFIQDGFLRDVPMAALYDKNESKYLIEKYAVATTSSLQLTDLKPLSSQVNRALILALSQESKIDNKVFPELVYFPIEYRAIRKIFPESKKLENEEFAIQNLKREMQEKTYPIIHIATHAQFGILPEDTFLVIGNNEKLTIDKLEAILRQSGNISNAVELLTLTACETATGDDRATLGLAGVALQAGTKSALASLWSVDDDSTANLIAEFYDKLRNSGMSKAQALQAAQLKLINAKQIPEINDKYDHPYYWSAFILIGNWL